MFVWGLAIGASGGWLLCRRNCRRRVRAVRAAYNDRLATLYNEVKKLRRFSDGSPTR